MIGSFITRGLVLIFGYAYPAYECYKSVDMNNPDIKQLRFWCQYWILVAGLTVFERIGDVFMGWVPMYGEAKLAFFVYLWFPSTKGTTYVYDSFFKPYVAKHETEIDRSLLELRMRAGDMALLYWQKAASYVRARVFDILQYVAASQPTPKQPAQSQHQATSVQKPTPPSTTTPQPHNRQTSSSTPSSEPQEGAEEEAEGPSEDTKPAPAPAASNEPKIAPTQAVVESSKTSNSNKEQVTQIDSLPPSKSKSVKPTLQDMVMQEAGRVTRAKLRKARTASSR